MYTTATLLRTREGMNLIKKRFYPKTNKIYNLANLPRENLQKWFDLYGHRPRVVDKTVFTIKNMIFPVPISKTRDAYGIPFRESVQILNNSSIKQKTNLLRALADLPNEQTRVIVLKKEAKVESVDQCIGIHILPQAVRLFDKSLVSVYEKMRGYVNEKHPEQYAFIQGRSTQMLIEDFLNKIFI